jgi:hypothetical protein
MNTREELWAEYQRLPRPPNIGDTINGVSLGEVDDDVQDVLGSWGMGADLGMSRVATLGLAVANLERILPLIAPEETRQYFALVSALGRSALDSLAQGEFDTGRFDSDRRL